LGAPYIGREGKGDGRHGGDSVSAIDGGGEARWGGQVEAFREREGGGVGE
jgi:hypothetical protein